MARQMKDSGIEWIGEIPEGWELLRMKSCIAQRDSGAWGEEATGEEGDTICLRIADFDYARFRFKDTETDALTTRHYDTDVVSKLLLHKNDILIEKSGGGEKTPVGRTVLFDKSYPALFANFMDRLRCASFVYPSFMQYLFVTFYKNDYTRNYIKQTTGIQNLDLTSMLANEKVAIPSLNEQHRIAAFLDRQCDEIDAVIERTKATIEEYKKLKQAVITEAVTKGVRGARKMKDSGIEWIGEIPEEWSTAILKYSIRWKSEKGQPDATVLSLYRDYGVIPKDSRDDNHNVTSLDTSTYKVVAVGDFVINKMKAWQGSMAVSDYAGIVSPAYHVCEITNRSLNKRYLHHLLRNHLYIPEYTRLSTGMRIGQWDLGFDDFKNLPFIIPPIDEQAEIVECIENGLSQYDTLIAKKTALLTELETYKKSLIYEYVTGKKECPEIVQQVAEVVVYPLYPVTLNTKKTRFAQAMLMAKVLDMHGKGMGRVKLEKMLYTIEASIGFNFDTEYVREAAGPLHESIYKCEGIISRQNKWYKLHQSQYGVSYTPTKDARKYKAYYDKYFSTYNAEIERIIGIFKPYNTDQAEVVATLFAAWNDAVIAGKPYTDEDVVDDVLNNWHDSKKRYPKDMWLRAMAQMRKDELVPKGYGKKTRH